MTTDLRATVQALIDAARPFANYACKEPCGCHNCRARSALADARALLAQLQQAQPPGWQLVPIEPTEEMWTAGRDPIMYRDVGYHVPESMEAPPWRINPTTGKVELDKSKGTTAVHVWRAMIAAAPATPAAPVKTLTEDEIESAWNDAARSYRQHRMSIRGQQITPADSGSWHEAIAIQRAFAQKNGLSITEE